MLSGIKLSDMFFGNSISTFFFVKITVFFCCWFLDYKSKVTFLRQLKLNSKLALELVIFNIRAVKQ